MNETSNNLLPKLKPKAASINDTLVMSKILISKHWKLPPRAPTRHSTNTITIAPESRDSVSHPSLSIGTNYVKKQKQNRDAQRAYRERKANKMKDMEESIELLQKLVGYWKKKYKFKEQELIDLQKTIKSEIVPHEILVPRTAIKTPNKCGFCNNDSNCVCMELEQSNTEVASVKEDGESTFNCSSNPSTCEKCSNIDETCIPSINNTPTEVDFTFSHLNSLKGAIPLKRNKKYSGGSNTDAFQRIKKQMRLIPMEKE